MYKLKHLPLPPPPPPPLNKQKYGTLSEVWLTYENIHLSKSNLTKIISNQEEWNCSSHNICTKLFFVTTFVLLVSLQRVSEQCPRSASQLPSLQALPACHWDADQDHGPAGWGPEGSRGSQRHTHRDGPQKRGQLRSYQWMVICWLTTIFNLISRVHASPKQRQCKGVGALRDTWVEMKEVSWGHI